MGSAGPPRRAGRRAHVATLSPSKLEVAIEVSHEDVMAWLDKPTARSCAQLLEWPAESAGRARSIGVPRARWREARPPARAFA